MRGGSHMLEYLATHNVHQIRADIQRRLRREVRVKRRPLRCWLGQHHWLRTARWHIEGAPDAEQFRCYYCDQLGHRRVGGW